MGSIYEQIDRDVQLYVVRPILSGLQQEHQTMQMEPEE